MISPEIDKAFTQLIIQWNIAERRIKKAEQVRGEQIVSSAIFELRYAGRKIVDALELCLSGQVQPGSEIERKVLEYLGDATEDCVKAKHDAIDAMLSFVTVWFDRVEKSLTLNKVQQFFPNYLDVTGKIAGIQESIEESRGNRNTKRDKNYDDIEKDGYDEILALYKKMKTSRDRVQTAVGRERVERIALWTVTILSVLATIYIGASSAWGWWPYQAPATSTPVATPVAPTSPQTK